MWHTGSAVKQHLGHFLGWSCICSASILWHAMLLSKREGQVQDAYLGEKEAKGRYDPNNYANKIAPKHRRALFLVNTFLKGLYIDTSFHLHTRPSLR